MSCDTYNHLTVIAKCADALLVRRQIGRFTYQFGIVANGEIRWHDSEFEARSEFFKYARAAMAKD